MVLDSASQLQSSLHTGPQSSEASSQVLQAPDFSVIINENELPKERVISIKTVDTAGIMSDSCEIELDDYDDALTLPKTEAKIAISLGYKGGASSRKSEVIM
jgi:phage protein D